jgi:hypothetical protein
MNSKKLTGLAAGTAAGDSVRFEQLLPEVPTVLTANTVLDATYIRKLASVDATSGAITITMPSAVTVGNGGEITVMKSDQSANFVTINSVSDQLLGYSGKSYAFHATAGTAVSNNGGFVRVRIAAADENYGVFRTGDRVLISGAVGFAALNAQHVITRPTDASGESYRSIDLPSLAYAAGYTSGGTIAFIQTSHVIRVVNGGVTYVSNGTHWVVKPGSASSDIFLGPKDDLFHARNPDYAGPNITMSAINDIDAYFNAYNGRGVFRDAKFIARKDPVDVVIACVNGERFGTDAASIANSSSIGTIFWQGSSQTGTLEGQMCSIASRAAEDITTVGNGSSLFLGTTPLGKRESETGITVLYNGDVWLGAVDRGVIYAQSGRGLQATKNLTASANASDGDTVTIDTVVYTFESGVLDASTATAVEVLLGATAAESIQNLVHAINATGTQGTTYGTGNVRHTTVHATVSIADPSIMVVYARDIGTAGNSIVIGETSGTLSWAGGATTLSGGEAINASFLGVKGDSAGAKVTVRAEGTSAASTSLRLNATGTAYVITDDPLIVKTSAGVSITTVGNETYTAAQCLGGIIARDCNGASRADTLPTAADLVAAIPGVAIGDTVRLYLINGSDAAETITITEGAGGAWIQTAASRVVPQNTSKHVHLRITNITAASEAYVVYA